MKTQYLNTVVGVIQTARGAEEIKRDIMHSRKLTLRGAERILRKMNKEDDQSGISENVSVCYIQHSQFCR
jgi:hypothetical protein